MTIRRAPTPKAASAPTIDLGKRTEEFINRGMQTPTVEPTSGIIGLKPVKVLLTIPPDSHSRIEALLNERSVRIPRHTWLLEAIVEKLEREERKSI